jgi:hypothetical protein
VGWAGCVITFCPMSFVTELLTLIDLLPRWLVVTERFYLCPVNQALSVPINAAFVDVCVRVVFVSLYYCHKAPRTQSC